MLLPKPLNNYLKNKEKNAPVMITEISSILRRSGYKNYTVFITDDQRLVLFDTNKDVMPGVEMKGNEVKGFKNTDDLKAVTVDAYARYNILNLISNDEDLERAKEIFRGKRTWVIHCVTADDGSFEAHTHGMENYSQPNFKMRVNIGEEEIAYLLNSLCKSVQRGNSFNDADVIENLYNNYDVKLSKTEDGFFYVELIDVDSYGKKIPEQTVFVESEEDTEYIPEQEIDEQSDIEQNPVSEMEEEKPASEMQENQSDVESVETE